MGNQTDSLNHRFIFFFKIVFYLLKAEGLKHSQIPRFCRIKASGLQCLHMDLKHGKVRKQDMSCLMSGQSDDAVCLKTPGGKTSGKEIRGIDMDQPVIGMCNI